MNPPAPIVPASLEIQNQFEIAWMNSLPTPLRALFGTFPTGNPKAPLQLFFPLSSAKQIDLYSSLNKLRPAVRSTRMPLELTNQNGLTEPSTQTPARDLRSSGLRDPIW